MAYPFPRVVQNLDILKERVQKIKKNQNQWLFLPREQDTTDASKVLTKRDSLDQRLDQITDQEIGQNNQVQQQHVTSGRYVHQLIDLRGDSEHSSGRMECMYLWAKTVLVRRPYPSPCMRTTLVEGACLVTAWPYCWINESRWTWW